MHVFSIPDSCGVNGLQVDHGVYTVKVGTIVVCLANRCKGDLIADFEVNDKHSLTVNTLALDMDCGVCSVATDSQLHRPDIQLHVTGIDHPETKDELICCVLT